MAAIGKVSAVFTASTSGLTSGVNRANASMKSLEASSRSTASGMRALVAINIGQVFASAVSTVSGYVNSLVRVGAAQADVIDRTSKLASRLGMTYGELSGLALAGDLAGVSMDQIAAAATKADVAFVKAANGSKPAIAAFQGLGLSVADLGGMNAADRFDAIAQAIASLPTEAQRAAAAVQIFGRAGAELLPLFNGGADAIRQAREEADAFGLSLTTAQGQDVEAMNDAFTRAQKAVEGVVTQVVAYLSPAVKGVFDTFTNFVANVGGVNIGQAIGDGILDGAEYLASVADTVISNLSGVWEYASSVGELWGNIGGFLTRVSAGFKAVFDGVAVVFLSIVRLAITPMSNIIEQVANLVSYLPGAIGDFAEQVAAGAAAFRDQLDADIADYGNAFVQNAGTVIDGREAAQAGQAFVGPMQQAVRGFRDAADQAAGQIEDAKPATPPEIRQVVEVAGITEAVKGIDSRSKEGVAEMFRLMRGGPGDVAQQQLGVLEQIAENTADLGDDALGVEF